MKRITLFGILAIAVLAIAGCQKEKDYVSAPGEVTITATRTDNATRCFLSEEGEEGAVSYPVYWDAPDQILVTYAGIAPATFTSKNDSPELSTSFYGTLPEGEGMLYGIYPAESDNVIDGEGYACVKFHDVQNAVEGTFDPMAFPAVAVSESNNLSFQNICGLLQIQVAADDVTSISLFGYGATVRTRYVAPDVLEEPDEPDPVSVPYDLVGGMLWVNMNGDAPAIEDYERVLDCIVLNAPNGGVFDPEATYYMVVPPCILVDGASFDLVHGDGEESYTESVYFYGTLPVERGKVHPVGVLGGTIEEPDPEPEPEPELELCIETVWLKQSGDAAWNAYYGGTGGTDRNIAMDDEYVYIAENSGTAKLWAISISDASQVKAVNVEGVTGGTHVLACPRVVKNTDSSVNGGKDVLICSNLTRGGEDPKLYLWTNGIDNPPIAITLNTWGANTAWYGDVFTVYGTLQNGLLLFDKIGGSNPDYIVPNGVVTWILNGVPSSALNLVSRINFYEALKGHFGASAYYPFPGDINHGIYSPGRGVEARGKSVAFEGDLKTEGAYLPTLTDLDFADGRNGFVLGYNFLEWEGKRYVIYGKQPDTKNGYVYVLEGESTAEWLSIVNTAGVKFRRDLFAESGSSLSSGNSGMDVTARVIGDGLYFAAQKQNVACGLYKLVYKPVEE